MQNVEGHTSPERLALTDTRAQFAPLTVGVADGQACMASEPANDKQMQHSLH